MLIGQYTSKLTEGSRVSIPKKFREELGESMVIAKWYEGCLVLVSGASWQKLISRLIGKTGLISSPVRDIDRFILGSAYQVVLDAQGRFVVPENLLAYLSKAQEVVFVGLGDRVEIWPSEKWQKLEADAEAKASTAIDKLAEKQNT